MDDKFLALKTDQSLLSDLRSAAQHKPSQAELSAQKVSFVFGFLKTSSGITREQVKNVVVGAGA